jgi:hypothetical protein
VNLFPHFGSLIYKILHVFALITGTILLITQKFTGVIPRAAQALFNMLGGSLGNRNSGIRAPVRYSTPIATLQRNNPDKGWTMKATYVEVWLLLCNIVWINLILCV